MHGDFEDSKSQCKIFCNIFTKTNIAMQYILHSVLGLLFTYKLCVRVCVFGCVCVCVCVCLCVCEQRSESYIYVCVCV